jgi:arylsulfatase
MAERADGIGAAGSRGKIGRTADESVPDWAPEVRPPRGAPHVVYLVFDDLGFADLGCYGSEIATPHLDALAANGLRFTNFHTTALCSPTRACLLTGRNHHSVGMAQLANWDLGFPGSRGRIAKSAGTLAEMLRPHGYNTFAVGKWHLTPMSQTGPAGPFDQWPTQRGFDRFYGFLEGCTNQWEPVLTEDNHHIEAPRHDGYHLTPDLVDHAIEWIRDQQSAVPGKPFFLYLCFGATHSPHHVPREFIEKYVTPFEKGWDRTREDRLRRQKELGIVPAHTRLAPRNPDVRPWDELSADERRLAVRLQAAFAGMLEHTDLHVGRLVGFLREQGLLDDTLLITISDNGASQEGSAAGTLHQGRYFERAPITIDQALAHVDEIGETQWFNNYPLGWAMAGNTPCKWYKQNTHGGGVRDPMIVHWPARIRAPQAGGLRAQFHHVTDVTPTVLELSGIGPPSQIQGVAQQPLEGESFAYVLDDPGAPTRKHTQYFEMLGHRGIVHEGWKAVARHRFGERFDDDRWELYRIDEDFSESSDLAEAEPAKLRELIERWWVEAGRYRVLPIDERGGGSHIMRRPFQRRFVLRGGAQLSAGGAPRFQNRSFAITAELAVPARGAEGVILAHGDRWGGYVLYARGSQLLFHYHFPMEHTVIKVDRPLPAGSVQVGVRVAKVRRVEGEVSIRIGDEVVATGHVPRIIRGWPPFGGLSCGFQSGAPVGDYEAPFRFNGTVERVVYEILSEEEVDRAVEARAAMGTQ